MFRCAWGAVPEDLEVCSQAPHYGNEVFEILVKRQHPAKYLDGIREVLKAMHPHCRYISDRRTIRFWCRAFDVIDVTNLSDCPAKAYRMKLVLFLLTKKSFKLEPGART
ncbi:unnamed protein product [Chondrus crispus]|uniref:Uncharacterized protein n=1 Tax=Chondrus crispus TaxID=2769 RepID=R7QQ48_CHOCR|nr:unnamed protein product [Chondrus crispus]CDF39480.1 unnamed protein product [Chondrus crispus]|eukprot:XP_005719391.1 unnamed protein product [Chondrus crispus]